MKTVVMNETIIKGKINFINEESYQQFKKDMGKTNDYFNIEEWNKLVKKTNTLFYNLVLYKDSVKKIFK